MIWKSIGVEIGSGSSSFLRRGWDLAPKIRSPLFRVFASGKCFESREEVRGLSFHVPK